MTKFQQLLARIAACQDSRAWVGNRSFVEAWNTCQRPDWLLFFADKTGTVTPAMWRLLACAMARSCVQHNSDPRVIGAIETAERHARGQATDQELSAAQSAAWSAAQSAAWSAALSAAWSAAQSAAQSATWSATLSAAHSAALSAAWSAAQSAQCDLIRKHLDVGVLYRAFRAQETLRDLFPGDRT